MSEGNLLESMSLAYHTDTLPSRHAFVDGRQYLWFSGTDYLGMAYHPLLLKSLSEGINTLGSHYGSSRNNNLQINAYREAELAIAEFTDAEDAVLVSSGMLAGALTRQEIEGLLQKVYSHHTFISKEAPLLHPALRRSPSINKDWSTWSESIAEGLKKDVRSSEMTLIFSDAIGTPKTTRFDFSIFSSVENCFLIVDDSHGIGVIGENGRGAYSILKRAGVKNSLVIASLNKALGSPGGVILGEKHILDKIRETPFYSGASPIPPIYAHALHELISNQAYPFAHQSLTENNQYFAQKIAPVASKFYWAPGYPAYTSDDAGLSVFLRNNGILTSSFHYPSSQDPLLTRIVISAVHKKEDLDLLAEACLSYFS